MQYRACRGDGFPATIVELSRGYLLQPPGW